MKAKKILALVFALVLILATALPAHAAEGGEIPDTEDPGTEYPGMEDPGTEDPGTEDPGTEDPGTEDPGTEDPGTEDPGTGDPGTEDPGTEDPGTEDPGTEDPGTNDPGTEDPGTNDPGTNDPGTEDPGTEDPGTEDPGTEDPGTEDPGNEIPGEPEPDVINVQVPATGQVIINPYQMEVAVSSGVTTDQIIHESQALASGSDFPVLVSARAVGTLSYESEARFVQIPPASDAPDKQIFMYVEFQPADFSWSGVYSDAPNQLLVTDLGMEKENVLTLDPFGVGYFRLFGSLTESPDTMWGSIDAPNVTLAFTFAPMEGALPEEDGSLPVDAPEFWPEDNPWTLHGDENFPADGNVPVDENFPSDENPSVDENFPSDENPPVDGSFPSDENPPVDENFPVDENPPVDESLPVDENPPVDENFPADENFQEGLEVGYGW